MTHLDEIVQTIEGIKLQADCAIKLMTDKSPIIKNELKKAHKMINSSILYGKTLSWFMKEKEITIFPEINIEDFIKWYKANTTCDCRCAVALTSLNNDKKIHLTTGILFSDEMDFGKTSLCNLNIDGFYGICIGDPLIKHNKELDNLIKDILIHEEDKVICSECELIANELYLHLYKLL